MKQVARQGKVFLFSIILISLLIRIISLSSQTLWYDEAFSILFSEKGPGAILQGTLAMDAPTGSADIHPPAYYFLLFGWIQVFGRSILSGRILSILFGTGILINVYLLAKELLDQNTALLASFFVAILPFQVHYAAEIRMYSMLAFFLTLSALAYFKALRINSLKWWGVFVLSSAIAQYTHNLAAFFLLPLASISLFKRNWRLVHNTCLAGLTAVILYLPWLLHLPAQFSKVQHQYWVTRPTLVKFIDLILCYITNIPLPKNWLMPGLFISLTCVTLCIYQTIRASLRKSNGYKTGLLLMYLSFAPAILLWLVSQWTPVYIDRALLASHAIFCIWMAWVLIKTAMPDVIRLLMSAAVLVGAVVGLSYYYTNEGNPIDAHKTMDAYLREHMQGNDIIIHSNKLSYLPAFYHGPDLPMLYIIDEPGSMNDTLSLSTRRVLGLNYAEDIESAVGHSETVWLIIYESAINDYTSAGYSTHPDLAYLDQHYQLVSVNNWSHVLLYEYRADGR